MAAPTTPHDALFKRTFSDPAHVRDELRAVLSPALLAQLNLATLRPCPGSFVDQALAGSHSDLLFLTLWALRDGRHPKRLLASLRRWAHLLDALFEAPSGRDALAVLVRYLSQVSDLPAETLVQAVERVARSEGLMATVAEQWVAQGRAEGRAEGQVESQARAVLSVLEARGLSVTAAQRAKVLGCTDLAQLEGWVRKAATAKTTAELFAAPKRPAKARR